MIKHTFCILPTLLLTATLSAQASQIVYHTSRDATMQCVSGSPFLLRDSTATQFQIHINSGSLLVIENASDIAMSLGELGAIHLSGLASHCTQNSCTYSPNGKQVEDSLTIKWAPKAPSGYTTYLTSLTMRSHTAQVVPAPIIHCEGEVPLLRAV